MSLHEVWHVSVLTVTLLGAAAAVIVGLGRLLFDQTPRGLDRARPAALGLAGAAIVLLTIEWIFVHP